MFEVNGLVYGSEPSDEIRVVSVKDVGDFILLVTFSTGETRLVDCTELFAMPAFAKLADLSVFETIAVVDGALTWLGGEIDIAPEGLFSHSYEYPVAM